MRTPTHARSTEAPASSCSGTLSNTSWPSKGQNDTHVIDAADARPHRSLDLGVPAAAQVAAVIALPSAGRVDRVDVLGGLIHEYRRAA
jgi:hypothetical protein